MSELQLSIFGGSVSITCEDTNVLLLIKKKFSALLKHNGEKFTLRYSVRRNSQNAIEILENDRLVDSVRCEKDFLFCFEKILTLKLQEQRTDLYFVHGAVLEYQGRCCIIAAEAGSGKSTTAWALLHYGFRYLSDELAPIDFLRAEVLPFPLALCLKAEPPSQYPFDKTVLKVGSAYHIQIEKMPAEACTNPVPLSSILFLKKYHSNAPSTCRVISSAEAAVRLYSNTLNALAHPGMGLDRAIEICRLSKCYEIGGESLKKISRILKKSM
jgi:hypothetical protein